MNCRRCGEWHNHDGRLLCDECLRRCACGEPAAPKRKTCATCFAKLASAIKAVKAGPGTCPTCGTDIYGSPSARPKFCSETCRPKPKSHPCVVCGKVAPRGRQTCSDACHATVSKRRADALAKPGRTPAQRSRSKNSGYKGKDKAAVIARLTVEQGGQCAVCFGEGVALGDGTKGLVLDHCHTTGRARSLLCTRCNAALGLMREDPTHIESLLDYARRVRSQGNV